MTRRDFISTISVLPPLAQLASAVGTPARFLWATCIRLGDDLFPVDAPRLDVASTAEWVDIVRGEIPTRRCDGERRRVGAFIVDCGGEVPKVVHYEQRPHALGHTTAVIRLPAEGPIVEPLRPGGVTHMQLRRHERLSEFSFVDITSPVDLTSTLSSLSQRAQSAADLCFEYRLPPGTPASSVLVVRPFPQRRLSDKGIRA